ncbi:hypothetical protein apy_09880 [Aeropyrum pernix]|uniref:Uncharacterized protein n=1 Tax=Aeropyrum pernix TaxID=56636 RepID=A0A401HA23_AERPX|nr:hypothetical protein apy_09880 [Aeropyrum pernix]
MDKPETTASSDTSTAHLKGPMASRIEPSSPDPNGVTYTPCNPFMETHSLSDGTYNPLRLNNVYWLKEKWVWKAGFKILEVLVGKAVL